MTKRIEDLIIYPPGTYIHRLEVESSNVAWIGWPITGEPLMIVQFQSGDRYSYAPVSRQQAVAAAYAESVGGYINRKIKSEKQVMKLR